MADRQSAPSPVEVAAFYKFVDLPDYRELREPLYEFCIGRGIRGTILLAEEGINATIAGAPGDLAATLERLRSDRRFADLAVRVSQTDAMPFKRTKVKLKREIVNLGVDDIDPVTMAGTYVPPEDWNGLISQQDVVVIDTRNDYEVGIGSFEGARDPGIGSFSELPAWLARQDDLGNKPRVAMFCTGGIRCEKSTAYLRKLGFEEIYHLEGGILNYLEQIPESQSLWRGECFVFDERVSVRHCLAKGTHRLCADCGRPVPDDSADTSQTCAFCARDETDA